VTSRRANRRLNRRRVVPSVRRHADAASARLARAEGEDVIVVTVDALARENARARGE
jgi:hypothetical protein